MMKKAILGLIMIFALSANAQYKLDFKVDGLKDTTVYLLRYLGDKLYYADTTESKGGKASFSNDYYEGGIYAFYTGEGYFEFVMADKQVSMHTSLNNFVTDMKVIKSDENKAFYEYIHYINSKRPLSEVIVKERDALDPIKDSLKIKSLNNKLVDLDKEVKQFQKDIVKRTEGKLVSKMLKMSIDIEVPADIPDSLRGAYLRDHYWDNTDLTDKRLARSQVFNNKIDFYFKKMMHQIPDTIIRHASFMIDQIEDSSDMMKFVLNYVHVNYETSKIMGMDAVYVGMSLKYYCPPNENKAWWYPEQNLIDRCEQAKTWEPLLIGKVAPSIRLADTTEKKWINVQELKNDYKVLIFWDPDCGHCKKEIPKLLEVYHELQDKKQSVEFIGISTELDNEKWIKMVKDKEMDWVNLSDFPHANKNAGVYVYEKQVTDFESLNFRKTYDIFSTPQIYLLDKDNKIVAKRLDANNLARILERKLDITIAFKEEPKKEGDDHKEEEHQDQ